MGIRQLREVDPRRIASDLTSGRTLFWVGVALVIHVVLIGATSMGYIRDRWIDPAGAQARAQARQEAAAREQEAKKAAETQPAAAPTAPTTAPVAKAAAPKREADPDAAAEQRLLEQRKDSKVVRDITEAAKPEEIPKEPSRNGFELDEALN